jgi:hypothetical protein
MATRLDQYCRELASERMGGTLQTHSRAVKYPGMFKPYILHLRLGLMAYHTRHQQLNLQANIVPSWIILEVIWHQARIPLWNGCLRHQF